MCENFKNRKQDMLTNSLQKMLIEAEKNTNKT